MRQADQRIAELVQAGADSRRPVPAAIRATIPHPAKFSGLGTGFIALELTRIAGGAPWHRGPCHRISVAEGSHRRLAKRHLRYGVSGHGAVARRRSGFRAADFSVRLHLSGAGRLDDTTYCGRRSAREFASGWWKATPPRSALRRLVTRAEFVGVELPDEAVDLIKNDKADLLAFPRDHLIIFAEQVARFTRAHGPLRRQPRGDGRPQRPRRLAGLCDRVFTGSQSVRFGSSGNRTRRAARL